jgi:dihydrofolate synthase / folylpolyglutamate synthase
LDYAQAIAWLYSTQARGIKVGVAHVRELLHRLNIHNLRQRFIHVAGTNGKGSVCAMIHAICRSAGLSTGLFTSPHLIEFTERIQLNEQSIPREDVADGLTRIRQSVEQLDPQPTFFELTTALALDWFQRCEAGIVVLETGMGGRLDATNVVTPIVSVLTPIALDHQTWLGDSLEEIAAEKSGIIKARVPVVSSAQDPVVVEVITKVAQQKQSPVTFVTRAPEDMKISLAGNHQRMNAALALTAVREAGISVSEEVARAALRTVQWRGRFQRIGERIVLDGAHNPAAMKQLVNTWREYYGDEKPTLILGVLRDKDVRGICSEIASMASHVILTPVRSSRSCTPHELAEIIRQMDVSCEEAHDGLAALRAAEIRSGKILVTGSLFLVGEMLALLQGGSTPLVSDQ